MLLDRKTDIKRLFNNSHFGLKTLREQLSHLMNIMPELRDISVETYRRFLQREKVATYKSFTRVSPTVNSDKNKAVRLIVLRILLEVIDQDHVVLFFDEIHSELLCQEQGMVPEGKERSG